MFIGSISQELIKKAVVHSEQRIKTEYDRFKLRQENRRSMIVIGTIGELFFKEVLESNRIQFESETCEFNWCYDKHDFLVNNEIVEIKTSGHDYRGFNHLNLLYSEDQFQTGLKKSFKYCVQIFINGYNRESRLLEINKCNQASIVGFIPFNLISNFHSKKKYFGDDYKVPIERLQPIENLIIKGKRQKHLKGQQMHLFN